MKSGGLSFFPRRGPAGQSCRRASAPAAAVLALLASVTSCNSHTVGTGGSATGATTQSASTASVGGATSSGSTGSGSTATVATSSSSSGTTTGPGSTGSTSTGSATGTTTSTTATASAGGGCPDPCPVGQKPLIPVGFSGGPGMTCVSTSDPSYGCGVLTAPGSCAQLNPNAHHVVWGCSNGACVIAGCDPSFADCDGNPADGCESDLKSTTTCGSCATSCGASQVCTATGCASACPIPTTYCNGACVNLATTTDHCGSCANACAQPIHGTAQCLSSMCVPACASGYVPVNGNCVDENTDPTCCGPSCLTCPAPFGGEARCNSGVCGDICPPGLAVCAGKCADTQRDIAHCGGCGSPCAGICSGGTCDPTAKQVIATGSNVTSLAADGTSVFWVNNGTDVMQVARDGSSSPLDLASAQQGAMGLAIDEAYVYWVNFSGGGVWRATKGVPGAAFVVAATSATTVHANTDYLYWNTNHYWVPAGSIAKTSASPLLSTWGATSDFSVDDSQLFYANNTITPASVVRANLDGSAPVIIGSGTGLAQTLLALGPNALGYHDHSQGMAFAYSSDKLGGNKRIWRFPKGSGPGMLNSQAIDATDLFITLNIASIPVGITRFPLCGGPVENISPVVYADDVGSLMAVDDLFVYTVDASAGIHRTAK